MSYRTIREKRIVSVENVSDEDEYNQFDEIPPSISSSINLVNTNDGTPYLCTDNCQNNSMMIPLYTFVIIQ